MEIEVAFKLSDDYFWEDFGALRPALEETDFDEEEEKLILEGCKQDART